MIGGGPISSFSLSLFSSSGLFSSIYFSSSCFLLSSLTSITGRFCKELNVICGSYAESFGNSLFYFISIYKINLLWSSGFVIFLRIFRNILEEVIITLWLFDLFIIFFIFIKKILFIRLFFLINFINFRIIILICFPPMISFRQGIIIKQNLRIILLT